MSGVNAITCPNCGASVEIEAAPGELVKCSYCGTALQLPESPHAETPPQIVIEVPQEYTRIPATTRKSKGGGVIVFLAVVLPLIGLAIGLVAAFAPALIAPTYYLWEAPVPLQPIENPNPDLIVQVRNYDDDLIRLALLDGQSHKLRWTSSQSFSSDSRPQPIAGTDLVYLNDKTSLFAFHAADGTLAWQRALPYAIGIGCKNCIRLFSGQLVILSQDGTLQAFNANTGTTTWTKSLGSSPTELLLAGGKPAVVGQDANHKNGLYLFDVQTGAQTILNNGLCQGQPDAKTNPPQDLEEVYLSPDGSLAYLMYYGFGFGQRPCAQQVDLASGKVVWSAVPKEGQTWPSAWFASEVAVTDEGVFFYEENVMAMIDSKTGAMKDLFKEPRYREITPLVSQSGRLFVLAIPDYDSEAKELWGIDLATGARTWTFKMQARSIIDPWEVKLTSSGLVVVQCVRDNKVSTWDTLDPATGSSLGSLKLSDQDFDFLEDTWTPTTAYLKIDSTLYTVSVKTGTTLYTWP